MANFKKIYAPKISLYKNNDWTKYENPQHYYINIDTIEYIFVRDETSVIIIFTDDAAMHLSYDSQLDAQYIIEKLSGIDANT